MTEHLEQLFNKARLHWRNAIASVGAGNRTTMEWYGAADIGDSLTPFLGENVNHAHYPTGGGQDWKYRELTGVDGCLALAVEDGVVDLFKPEHMILEHFPDAVQESFLLIELANLAPDPVTSVYEGSQEYGELPDGRTFDRSAWDAGYLDHDVNGLGTPVPDNARLVVRWLNGKILVVAKGSMWNGTPATYNGNHNDLSASQIRQTIETALAQRR